MRTSKRSNRERFSLSHHVPHYSRVLLEAMKSPLLVYFTISGNLILFICASTFYWAEFGPNPNVHGFFDAIWWAFCTVSTVGFGDIVPVTLGGRVAGIFLMVFGVMSFVGFTAILVSVTFALTAREIAETEALTQREYEVVLQRLEDLSKKIQALTDRL